MRDCFKYNIDLQWLNSTGGWEHFRFTAWKTYGWDVSEAETFKKDVFQNWDTDFIAGQTQESLISISSRPTVVVRSQDLTRTEMNAIARIRHSIRVNDETDPDNIVTVMVENVSGPYRTDNDKRFEFVFVIRYPDEQIQTQ